MAVKDLPARPNLEQYKKQAKDLVKSRKSGDAEALRRIRQHHPRFERLPDSELQSAAFALADAQFVIAREHGFESWPKFARHVEALSRDLYPASVWKAAKDAVIAGDVSTLERLLRDHPWLRERQPPAWTDSGPIPSFASEDARSIILREHYFETWADFERHLRSLKSKTSPAARFEAAVDAVVAGDLATLERLLREDGDLIRRRSARTHRSTLLHYVGANGVEGFRQRTPKNAVKIAEVLLAAGAEVDAVGEMYRGTTTLGLVATSIHPLQAGVQEELIEVLLAHGASLDGAVARDYTGGRVVNACLANGRGEAAEFLARRGARLDLEGAAGAGRLDLVKSFFKKDGSLKAGATKAQMHSGLHWACEYGRTGVVAFLLERGIELAEKHRGETSLHWAALAGQLEIVEMLLERGAPVDVKDDNYGSTPLGWALYGWGDPPPESKRARYCDVVACLVAAGAPVEPEWLASEKVRADPCMLAALSGPSDARTNSSDGEARLSTR